MDAPELVRSNIAGTLAKQNDKNKVLPPWIVAVATNDGIHLDGVHTPT